MNATPPVLVCLLLYQSWILNDSRIDPSSPTRCHVKPPLIRLACQAAGTVRQAPFSRASSILPSHKTLTRGLCSLRVCLTSLRSAILFKGTSDRRFSVQLCRRLINSSFAGALSCRRLCCLVVCRLHWRTGFPCHLFPTANTREQQAPFETSPLRPIVRSFVRSAYLTSTTHQPTPCVCSHERVFQSPPCIHYLDLFSFIVSR